MAELHQVFGKVVDDKIRAFPDKAKIIKTAKERGRLLAVRGSMDYVENVLPHCYAAEKLLIDPNSPPENLTDFDVVFIGCPGELNLQEWQSPLLTILNEGGVLLTTDWCLGNVVQKLFPETICKKGTAHGEFPLRVRQPDHLLLQGIANCEGTPWVVETSSHRIHVLDPKQVQVLLDAPSMGGDSAVLVAFEVGRGLVVHAISHFHLQGSEESGEYVSAYILTNVIDEAMRRRYPEPHSPRVHVIEPNKKLRIRIIKSS